MRVEQKSDLNSIKKTNDNLEQKSWLEQNKSRLEQKSWLEPKNKSWLKLKKVDLEPIIFEIKVD